MMPDGTDGYKLQEVDRFTLNQAYMDVGLAGEPMQVSLEFVRWRSMVLTLLLVICLSSSSAQARNCAIRSMPKSSSLHMSLPIQAQNTNVRRTLVAR
jgi:hypothetical protein